MEYVLKTNSLCKNYGHFKALNGLSMNVPKGSIYGLIGKNGAGKTTLIRLICGLQEPTSGDYVLYGKKHIDKDITKSRRRMGAIVETPSIYVDLTAYENLKEQYKGQNFGYCCFTGSSGAAEQIRMADTVMLNLICQSSHYVILTFDIREIIRSELSVKSSVTHE